MSKLLYTIKELFSTEPNDGCLGIHEAKRYYIAPYQRGYKWLSSPDWTDPAQVNTLLRDIYDAWCRNPESTYYLQFITVKRASVSEQTVLEVIDGQQRLTTLSILAAVLRWCFNQEDYAGSIIDYYSCGDDESQESKSKKCLAGFHEKGWMPNPHENVDDQTVWFMISAYQNLEKLLGEKVAQGTDKEVKEHGIDGFYKYLTTRTLVIVNLVQENVRGEEVFENLNGRRVTLTDAELIKGLLLCQAARYADEISYPEVLERRADMGRTWDEMDRWLGKKEVVPFFFGDNRFPSYDFLLLVLLHKEGNALSDEQASILYVAREEQAPSVTKRYRLFNRYYEQISSPNDALQLFRLIEDMYWKMRDAYEDVSRHNAFGFLFFRKNGVERLRLIGKLSGLGATWQHDTYELVLNEFANRGNEETSNLEKFLKTYSNDYKKDPEPIRLDLLLLNCFELGKDGEFKANDKLAFPFYDLEASATSSLEHVQCQTQIGGNEEDEETMADQLKKRLKSIQDWIFTVHSAEKICNCKDNYAKEAEELGHLLEAQNSDVLALAKKLEEGKEGDEPLPDNQWQQLAALYLALAKIHYGRFELSLSELRQKEFEGVKTTALHSIGNLVLVTGPRNTALLNRVFMAKKKVMRDKVNTGETIPPHTFNVFSKMNGTGGPADCWCAEDVAANAVETLTLLCNLRQKLEQYGENEGDKK